MSASITYCRASNSRVIDSRPQPYGIRRRRHCESCDSRWTTVEISIQSGVSVIESLMAAEQRLKDTVTAADQAASQLSGFRKAMGWQDA